MNLSEYSIPSSSWFALNLSGNYHHYHDHHLIEAVNMTTNLNLTYLTLDSTQLAGAQKLSDLVFLLIYAVIFLVGLVGNVLVIYFVLFYKRMQTMTNKLITNLSIADLLVICFCVPVTASQHFSHNWLFGEVVCRASGFVQGNNSIQSFLFNRDIKFTILSKVLNGT